jgi:virulence-associated protein VagC
MSYITTNLTTSGNSVAVRLPKDLLRLSGLTKRVSLQAKNGQIIISNVPDPRHGWKSQIEKELKAHGELSMIDDYGDMSKENDATLTDGLS